jgi:general stress protein 26
MEADDPAALAILRRGMVARIATLSRNGRPSVNPLYFVYVDGKVWLGTAAWTLAARNVRATPRVSVLFNLEMDPGDCRVVRVTGRAAVRTDAAVLRPYNLRVAFKYLLTFKGIYKTSRLKTAQSSVARMKGGARSAN